MSDAEAAVILRNWVEAFETDGLYRTAEAVQRAVDALEREVIRDIEEMASKVDEWKSNR